jgi:hypothetical protein
VEEEGEADDEADEESSLKDSSNIEEHPIGNRRVVYEEEIRSFSPPPSNRNLKSDET